MKEFLDFARKNSMSCEIRCPCKKCKTFCYKEPNEIREHIMRKGFVEKNYEWEYHQNTQVGTTSDVVAVVGEQSSNNPNPYSWMVYDAVASVFPNTQFDVVPVDKNHGTRRRISKPSVSTVLWNVKFCK